MQAMAHAGRLSSHLADQIEAQTRDPDWTLAHYTFVASVTTLASECDIAHSPAMSVASSLAPFQSPGRLRESTFCRLLPGRSAARRNGMKT